MALVWLVAPDHRSGGAVLARQDQTYSVNSAGYLDGDSVNKAIDAEQIRDVAVDDDGNVYLVGGTQSYNFPTTSGAFATTIGRGGRTAGDYGATDVFVTKLDALGQIVWSTYLGGPNYDRAYAVEVDATGHVYVAGRAGRGFPTTPGAAQPDFAGDTGDPRNNHYGHQDGFISKLAPDGSALIWSTYFGDTASGFVRDIDVDRAGNVYIAATAMTGRLSWITRDAAQPGLKGLSDAVYAKLAADGRTILYGTYHGGTTGGVIDGENPSIRVGPNGVVYMTAFTAADDAPVTDLAYQKRRAGGLDLTLAKYAPDGALLFSTYLGGSGDEAMEMHGLAIGDDGHPIVAGATGSPNFPTTARAFQPGPGSRSGGFNDGFIAKVSADGTRLLASTYLGGTNEDGVEGVAVAPDGAIVVTGSSASRDFPISPDALQSEVRGSAFILTKLDRDLTQIRYSTFYGGRGDDAGRSIAVAANGDVVAGGQTRSDDFPRVRSFDQALHGHQAAAYLRVAPAPR